MYVNKTKGLKEGKVGDTEEKHLSHKGGDYPRKANSKEGTRGRGDFERDNLD